MAEPRDARRRPGFAPVLWGSAILFAALFAFLTYQMSIGRDPLIGAAASGAASPRVLMRKVERRRIVTTVVPTPGRTIVSGSGPAVSASAASMPIVTGASG